MYGCGRRKNTQLIFRARIINPRFPANAAIRHSNKRGGKINPLNPAFINFAGEGGEFESLVLDAPNYLKRIKIVPAQKIMLNDFTGELIIKKAVLEKK